MNDAKSERGRPPEVAPAGHVTIGDAAEIAGVSYATVYRHVQSGKVRSEQATNGTIFVVRSDVAKIKRTKRPRSKHPSVTIRVEPKRLQRWEAAAGDQSVREWLESLADSAVDDLEK